MGCCVNWCAPRESIVVVRPPAAARVSGGGGGARVGGGEQIRNQLEAAERRAAATKSLNFYGGAAAAAEVSHEAMTRRDEHGNLIDGATSFRISCRPRESRKDWRSATPAIDQAPASPRSSCPLAPSRACMEILHRATQMMTSCARARLVIERLARSSQSSFSRASRASRRKPLRDCRCWGRKSGSLRAAMNSVHDNCLFGALAAPVAIHLSVGVSLSRRREVAAKPRCTNNGVAADEAGFHSSLLVLVIRETQ